MIVDNNKGASRPKHLLRFCLIAFFFLIAAWDLGAHYYFTVSIVDSAW